MPKIYAYHEATIQQHEAHHNRLKEDGYRILSLNVHGDLDTQRYAAVWIKQSGSKWRAFHNLTPSAYQRKFDRLTAPSRGYRPTIVTATGVGNKTVFAAVFEKDGKKFHARHGLTGDDFDNLNNKWAREKNFIPTCVTIYSRKDAPQYAAIWVKNTDNIAWTITNGDDSRGYQEEFNALTAGWARPAFVTLSDAGHYLAIWHDNVVKGGYARHDMTASEYQTEFDDQIDEDRYPFCVQVAGRGREVRYAALFVKNHNPVERVWRETGRDNPEFDEIDDHIENLMVKNNVRAGSIAIARNGRLVYARGYTWAEPGYPITQPVSEFRVASISKLFTSVAVHQLLESENEIKYGSKIQSPNLLDAKTLDGNSPVNARWNNVTIGRLLAHRGGWKTVEDEDGNDKVYDWTFRDRKAAEEMGIELPISRDQLISWVASRSDAFSNSPGEKYTYSNFGYTLLGEMLTKVYNKTYGRVIKENIFEPLGITRARVGRLEQDKQGENEVRYHYHKPSRRRSQLDNSETLYPRPYAFMNIRRQGPSGGWVMSTVDCVRFLTAFDQHPPYALLKPETIEKMWEPHPKGFKTRGGWNRGVVDDEYGNAQFVYSHGGAMSGTSTKTFRRADGLCVAVFFNRNDVTIDISDLTDIINRIDSWPTDDLFPSLL